MGMTASLTALSNDAFKAFDGLSHTYRPKGLNPEAFRCSLDKEWHMLHFLFTGTAEPTLHPLGILHERGPQMDAISDYCCAISPHEMVDFDEALMSETTETLRSRFDWSSMVSAQVYHADQELEPPNMFRFVTQGVPELRVFARKCAEQGCGAIVVIV